MFALLVLFIIILGQLEIKETIILILSTLPFSYFFSYKLNILPKKWQLNKYFLFYILWLIKEIVKSSVKVSKLMWQRKLIIDPICDYTLMPSSTPLEAVIYANSITLTPGTFTIEADQNRLLIHTLLKQDFLDFNKQQLKDKVRKITKVS